MGSFDLESSSKNDNKHGAHNPMMMAAAQWNRAYSYDYLGPTDSAGNHPK